MLKRLCENFIDENFSDYGIIKTYYKKELASIEIMPDGGDKSIYIWNNKIIDTKPVDSDMTCELEMNELEKKLQTKDGEKDVKEIIKYYLDDLYVNCLFVDFGDFKSIQEVDYDELNSDDVTSKIIKPILIDIGAANDDDNNNLAEAIEKILFKRKHLKICGVEMYYEDMSQREYRRVKEIC